MGADIHLFIEYDVSCRPGWWRHVIPAIKAPVAAFSREEFVKPFANGEFLIPRDYDVFAALARVRWFEGDVEPLYPPRGFPATASADVVCKYYRYVRDVDEPVQMPDWEVSRQEAETYVAAHDSHYRDHPLKPNGFVSDPDFHTPTWLLAAEFRAALAHHAIDAFESSLELGIVQKTLDELEARCGTGRARAVFWFDN
jgi:hypothetical protein